MTHHQSPAREPNHARPASHPAITLTNNPTDNTFKAISLGCGGVRFVDGGPHGAAREPRSNNPKATL